MELREFIHDADPVRNRELFGLLGEYAASPAIRDALGGFISSEPGRRWFVMLEDGARVAAFGSLRRKRTAAHLLHLYALKENANIAVLERCIQEAREWGAACLLTADYWTRREFYFRYGFSSVRKVGRFVRFKKELGYGN